MFKNRTVVAGLFLGSSWLLCGPAISQTPPSEKVTAAASTSTSTSILALSNQYSDFAGSPENAHALVLGLRDGMPIELTGSSGILSAFTPSASFTPVTGKLGLGNIDIALSLAKVDLAKLGITNPTPAQLQATLNGGTFASTSGPVTMAGILVQRQSGIGWGEIAKSMGVKLGTSVRTSNAMKAPSGSDKAAALNAHTTSSTHGNSGESHSSKSSGNGQGSGGNSGGGGSKK